MAVQLLVVTIQSFVIDGIYKGLSPIATEFGRVRFGNLSPALFVGLVIAGQKLVLLF